MKSHDLETEKDTDSITDRRVTLDSSKVESKNDKLSTIQLREDLSINDADLDGEMSQQSGLYGHYASICAMAHLQADKAKIRAEVARAKCYRLHRNRIIAKGQKPTEPQIEAEVMCDETYIAALELHATYKMQASLVKEALEALKQKRDMLVQKGVARREELKGDLFIKTKEREYEEAKVRARGATSK
ncbi:hypothetical protein [Shewanella glacialipiscicola]|uniref:hypothetical protein n=1 Tax=Shewanella glacialipiscicola TaxID=614069 RepID=UPI003D7A7E29